MKIIQCDPSYSEPILAIFNDAILNSTALYDYRPRRLEFMATWFDAKKKGNYPVLGAVTENGDLMGFSSFGSFRVWPAYKYTVEHSVYVAASFRGQGVGKRLLQEIIAAARSRNYHTLIGAIDSQNNVSLRLHEQLGFQHAGTIRQAGFKFGRWLDLVFYQLLLETPPNPTDG